MGNVGHGKGSISRHMQAFHKPVLTIDVVGKLVTFTKKKKSSLHQISFPKHISVLNKNLKAAATLREMKLSDIAFHPKWISDKNEDLYFPQPLQFHYLAVEGVEKLKCRSIFQADFHTLRDFQSQVEISFRCDPVFSI